MTDDHGILLKENGEPLECCQSCKWWMIGYPADNYNYMAKCDVFQKVFAPHEGQDCKSYCSSEGRAKDLIEIVRRWENVDA